MVEHSTPTGNSKRKISPFQKLTLIWVAAIGLPLGMVYAIVKHIHNTDAKKRSLRRTLCDAMSRYVSSLDPDMVRYVLGDTKDVYQAWTKQRKLARVTEDIGEGAQLHWIGNADAKKVILYVHGGAFLFGASDFALSFWRYVQDMLKKQEIEVGIAVLQYALVPDAMFPTQLKHLTLAVQHLFSKGLSPDDIQVVGDSAGANLILQLASHQLHPLPSSSPSDAIPQLDLPRPLRGLVLISPWATLTTETGVASWSENAELDLVAPRAVRGFGKRVLSGVPDSQRIYLEPATVPQNWFIGVDRVVQRVFVSAGGRESQRDDITTVVNRWKEHHPDVTYFVEETAVHDDPLFYFMAEEEGKGETTPLILHWLASGFSK